MTTQLLPKIFLSLLFLTLFGCGAGSGEIGDSSASSQVATSSKQAVASSVKSSRATIASSSPTLNSSSKPASSRAASVAPSSQAMSSKPSGGITTAMLEAGKAYYDNQCAGCHGSEGLGGSTQIPLIACGTCSTQLALQNRIDETMPPSTPGLCSNSNGCAELTALYIRNKFSTNIGGDTTTSGYSLTQIELLTPAQTLRKASLNIANRLPSKTEQDLVDKSGESGLDAALNLLLNDAQFYERLMEAYDDVLLLKGLDNTFVGNIVYSLDKKVFPSVEWFKTASERPTDLSEFDALVLTSEALLKASRELIKYIATNNKPFTEILTADYVMVNAFSAKSLGVYGSLGYTDLGSADWKNTAEKNWKPVTIANQPYAGMLSDISFQQRYPTTATNKNRARARYVYKYFLATDVLALSGNRELADDNKSKYPTKENPQCTICHSIIDPMASSFLNLRDGWFASGNLHRADMFDPGFESVKMPVAEEKTSLQWIAKQIVADDRFALAQVHNVYKGFTGLDPLQVSADASAAMKDAARIQREYFKDLASQFKASNYNIKTLVKSLLKSPYFRAKGILGGYQALHPATGAQQLLTPRMLDDKIFELLGVRWTTNNLVTGTHYLYKSDLGSGLAIFDLLYGGINFDDIVERIVSANTVMTSIQDKMAMEIGCRATLADFFRPQLQRKLLGGVESTAVPNNSADIAAIKNAIKNLHLRLWGEANQVDLDAAYELFYAIQTQGKSMGLGAGMTCRLNNDPDTGVSLANNLRISNDPEFTMRSWGAVIAYMLMDYRFLVE
jgi:cytochrome c5